MSAENPNHQPDYGSQKGDRSRKNYKKTEGRSDLPDRIEEKSIPESSEKSLLQLAKAIHMRTTKETKWLERIMSQRTTMEVPEEEEVPPPTRAQLKLIASMIKEASTPGKEPEAVVTDSLETVDEIFLERGDLDTLEGFEILEMRKQLGRRQLALGSKIKGEGSIEAFIELIAIANEVARENDTSPAAVFEDDELYRELLLTKYQTPEQYAQGLTGAEYQITPELFREVVTLEITLEEFEAGKSPEEIQEEVQRTLENSSLISLLDQQTATLNKSKKVVGGAMIKRLWGEEGAETLDTETREQLGIEKEPSDAAYALVHRLRKEETWRNNELQKITGQQGAIGTTSEKDLREKAKIVDRYLEALTDQDTNIEEAMETSVKAYAEYNPETMKTLLSEELQEKIADQRKVQEATTDKGIRPLLEAAQTAQEIAAQHDVSISEVYENDQLYAELIRAQHTPQTFASMRVTNIESITPDAYSEMDIMQKLINRELTRESTEGYETELREEANTTNRQEIRGKIKQIQNTERLLTKAMIERFWGAEELDALPSETKDALDYHTLTDEDFQRVTGEERRLVKDNYTKYVFLKRVNPSARLEEQIDLDPEVGDILDRYVFSNGEQADYQWRMNALPTAKRLAYEHGVELEEIYNNPELFTELQRQYFTAETLTEVELTRIEERFAEERVTERNKLKYLVERAEQGEPIDGQEQLLDEYYATEQGKAAIRELAARGKAEAMQGIEAKITELWGDGDGKGDTPKQSERILAREYANRVKMLAQNQDILKAVDYAEKVVELTPDNRQAWSDLGQLNAMTEQWEQAATAYEKQIELTPEGESAPSIIYRRYADVLDELGRDEEALAAVTKAIEAEPENPNNFHLRAYLYEKAGNLDLALADSEQIASLLPDHAVVRDNLRRIQMALEQWENAALSSERLLQLDPEKIQDEDFLDDYVQSLDRSDQLEKALEYQRKLTELNPDNARYWQNAGMFNRALDNHEAAIQDYTEAITRDPNNPNSWADRAEENYSQGNFGAAATDYLRWSELEPENPIPKNGYGDLQLKFGNYEAAEAAIKEAIEITDKPLYRANLGEVYYEQENYEAAEEQFQRSINMGGEYAPLYYLLALTKEKLGNLEQAAELLNKAQERAIQEEDQGLLDTIEAKRNNEQK